MKALYVSLGLLGHDGRQKELLDVLHRISSVDVVAPSLSNDLESTRDSNLIVADRNKRTGLFFYVKFLWVTIRQSYKDKYDFIFIDDYQASIVGVFLSMLHSKKRIIVDSREFYYKRKMPGLGRWLVKAEKMLIRRADIVIAANYHRANMMRILYKVSSPLVFENLREITIEKLEKNNEGGLHLVSTGGCSIERGTLELIKAVSVHSDVSLTIVGKGNQSDYNKILKEINERNITNVNIIERVPFKELCKILVNCDGGVIEYHMNDLNNYFCASGKIYEYLSIGMPVITTPNPPLADFIAKENCGVVAFDWVKGIEQFKNKYDIIKASAMKLSQTVDSNSHKEKFAAELLNDIERLEQRKKL
jgi:glycosyltransferase involved in cell wall biosynthesis